MGSLRGFKNENINETRLSKRRISREKTTIYKISAL